MKVTFYGIGYVGLVQAAVFANSGYDVVCVDIDEEKISNLKKGVIPIFEPGLAAIVEQNYKAGRLHFTTDVENGVRHSEYQFIAVGTPPDEDGSADLQHVLAVVELIASHMEQPKIIINKSTVPVGTADKVISLIEKVLKKRNENIDFNVVSNPEFLKEGSAVSDCSKPDRIIVGTDSDQVADKMHLLYAPFNRNHERMIVMDIKSSELTKYAANCMLATKISFMNEMANIAEQVGADIEEVRKGIGSDNRIGYHFIYPGCGYGGSCFPKDVRALIKTADQIGFDAKILKSVESVNKRQKKTLFDKINNHFNGQLKGRMFAIWGLSFKPNTDDMRDAPSRVLMEQLWAVGAKVQAFDPEAMQECRRLYGERNDLLLVETKEKALINADSMVLLTEWQQFKSPDFEWIIQTLKAPVIFDGRNQYDIKNMKDQGIIYYSIGRTIV